MVRRLTQAASTAVHSLTQGGATVLKSQVTGRPVDPVSLVLTMVQGAFTGYSIGANIADSVLEDFMMNKGLDYLRSPRDPDPPIYDPASSSEECSYDFIKRNNLPNDLKNHAEHQLNSGTTVHSFNDTIRVQTWVESIQRRMLDGRIMNDSNTKFIIITGGHGAEDGRSVFSDWRLLDQFFYTQDSNVSSRLQDGTLNFTSHFRLGPLRAKFELINLARFHQNETGLARAIQNAKLQFGQNHIVLAHCHSNSGSGDVLNLLVRNNL